MRVDGFTNSIFLRNLAKLSGSSHWAVPDAEFWNAFFFLQFPIYTPLSLKQVTKLIIEDWEFQEYIQLWQHEATRVFCDRSETEFSVILSIIQSSVRTQYQVHHLNCLSQLA